jgi:hypothetical protein
MQHGAGVIERQNPYLLSCNAYLGRAQTPRVWLSLEEWHRLRAIKRRHGKRGNTICRELINLGASEQVAKRVAGNSRFWRFNSKGDI